MTQLSETPIGVEGAIFAVDARHAISESLVMLTKECSDVFAQACAGLSAKKADRGGRAAGALRRALILERVGRLQAWIELHKRALDGSIYPAQFARNRSALSIEDPDVAPLVMMSAPLDDIDITVRRLEGRIRRLDELLHRPDAHGSAQHFPRML